MAIEIKRDSTTWQPPTDDAEDAVTEAMRNLARWLYRQLRSEYAHQTSDAAIDEIVAANEYTFTAEGRRYGSPCRSLRPVPPVIDRAAHRRVRIPTDLTADSYFI